MKLDSFENGELIGNVVNCSVDEDYLDNELSTFKIIYTKFQIKNL